MSAVRYWTEERVIDAIRAWAAEHGEQPRARQWARATPDSPAYATVQELFGCWNGGIRAAGFVGRPAQAPGPHKPWDADRIADAFLDFLLREGRWPTMTDCGVYRKGRSLRVAGLPSWQTVYRFFPSIDAAKRLAGWDGKASSAAAASGCVGCGCEFTTFSRGCKPCIHRRAARKQRAKKSQLVAAPHLVEPPGSEGGVSGAPHGAATPLANHNRGEAEAPAAPRRKAA